MAVAHHAVGEHELTAALNAILASETFTRSQQLSRLLKYLCETVVANETHHLAEYTIGTEALGRAADFDPTQDASVRVEMHRLRRRLRDYYETEGSHDLIRIVIPPGQYSPVITRSDDERKDTAPHELPAEVEVAPASPAESMAGPSRPAWRTSTPTVIVTITAFVALVVFSGWVYSRRSGSLAAARADVVNASPTLPPSSPLAGIRIRPGRNTTWTDRVGQIWGPDAYFEGGEAISIPARSYIAGAYDARLYESARIGTFKYRIPLPARTYEMRLYFIEPEFGPETDQGGEANRLFSLAINGRTIFERFDICADADGSWTADVRVFKDITPESDGYVHLDFRGVIGKALVNAIEFVPARPRILNPVRLLPQDNFYTDSAGNLWTPDNYSKGGRISLHPGPIKNTRDQELFRHERFGRFRYSVPVDRGSYSVYLYMAEEYWGPGNQGGGGIGTRVFSVFCNGSALLRSLDLFKESGRNYAVVRAFHHLTPNAQGKLMLSFEPEHDYASIYGLEVIDEAGPDRPSYERTVTGPGGL